MPWSEVNVVDIREEFVREALRDRQPFVALCRQYGISSKTGYKWKQRFCSDGSAGLADQSRRPRSHSDQLSEAVFCTLVRLKNKHQKWGPKKIRELLLSGHPELDCPSLSTVKRLLQRCGMVTRRRRRSAVPGARLSQRVEPTASNELWTVDFKGWWYSSERERIEPLTVRDAFSRNVVCAQALADGRTETVRACFVRLFKTYGLPEAIRSDNGAPFACTSAPLGLTRLSAWWAALGIRLDRITPGRPQENGAHERMHRDIASELEGPGGGSLAEQQAALELWRVEYNTVRPHEALGMRCPAELYRKSKRRYEHGPLELAYPPGCQQRRVATSGRIKIDGRSLLISTALCGWHVGLQAVSESVFNVWFAELLVGEIDLRTGSFTHSR